MAERHDPFESLKREEAGLHTPLPAAEVRALGDRRRRRRTTFRAVAAAAAVAVVATGGVALGGQLSGTPAPLPPATDVPSPEPTATPSPSPDIAESEPPETAAWVTEIPDGFPLALGYPEDRFEEQTLEGPSEKVAVFEQLHACDITALPRAGGENRLGVLFEQPEDTRARLLTTYDTANAAASVLDRHLAMYHACPREDAGFGGSTLTQVRDIDPGDEGFVAIRTFEQDGMPAPGLELIYVVRVGNALLLQSTENEGGGNEKLIYAQVREQTQVVAELADAMCVFSAGGCSGPAQDEASAAAENAERATLGPAGFAGVELGMTGAQIEASGRVTLEHGTQAGCSDFTLLSPERSEVIGGGYLSEEHGVEHISVSAESVRTPEGITLTSTLQEVTSAYPQGRWFDPTYVTTVPGFEDRQYSFTFAGGEATGILSMGVHLRIQSCTPNVAGTSNAP